MSNPGCKTLPRHAAGCGGLSLLCARTSVRIVRRVKKGPSGKGKPVTRLYQRPALLPSASCCRCRAACCLVVPAGCCGAAFRIRKVGAALPAPPPVVLGRVFSAAAVTVACRCCRFVLPGRSWCAESGAGSMHGIPACRCAPCCSCGAGARMSLQRSVTGDTVASPSADFNQSAKLWSSTHAACTLA